MEDVSSKEDQGQTFEPETCYYIKNIITLVNKFCSKLFSCHSGKLIIKQKINDLKNQQPLFLMTCNFSSFYDSTISLNSYRYLAHLVLDCDV